MKTRELENGQLLVADPFMQDQFFQESVILLVDHHSSGSIGFILNKPMRRNVKDFISDFPDFPGPVYLGGPVENNSLHYVHNAGELLEGSIEISSGIYWGGDFHQLKFLITNKVIKPRDIKFFVGYAGWESGQLAEEMTEENVWHIMNSNKNYIFSHDKESILWQTILSHKKESLGLLASLPSRSSLN